MTRTIHPAALIFMKYLRFVIHVVVTEGNVRPVRGFTAQELHFGDFTLETHGHNRTPR
jgi:hypothetical protein